jgi:hypothetical protein
MIDGRVLDGRGEAMIDGRGVIDGEGQVFR